jgi:hypothetical protein
MNMKPCPNRHETILLAAYGELDFEQRQDWEDHRTTCPGCRDEHEALLRLLGRIKESLPVPELSEKRASAILWSVKRKMRKEREKPSWWRQWLVRPSRLVPALAPVSIVLITFGLFGPNFREKSSPPQTIPDVESEVVIRDLDVLTNLDFLEDMDTLQDLLDVLDHNEPT